eukprot:767273-Hanusia_phi.AAC.4
MREKSERKRKLDTGKRAEGREERRVSEQSGAQYKLWLDSQERKWSGVEESENWWEGRSYRQEGRDVLFKL